MTTVQECAQKARVYLSLARLHPQNGAANRYYRNQAKRTLNEGKQLRAIKQQSAMFAELFRLASGGK